MAVSHLARPERSASGPPHERTAPASILSLAGPHSASPTKACDPCKETTRPGPTCIRTEIHGPGSRDTDPRCNARCFINKLRPVSLPLFSSSDPRTWGRLVVGCSDPSQCQFGNWYGSPRQAVGRHRRRPAARLRPRPPPQAGRPPPRRQDQRCGSGRRDGDPADDAGRRRRRAHEGHAQHHDQASGRVPLVAEERGQYAAGLAARVHAANLAVRYVPFRRRWWSLQKEIIFRCIREGNTTRRVDQSASPL